MFKGKEENLILKLPFGFRDIFPVEARERREIEDILKEEFTCWGYGEVRTPVIEFTRNISAGVGQDWKDKLISFFDNDGNIVSLRGDMTVPIARLTGMRIKPEQLPARFFYLANSFRQSDLQKGKKRVLNQAGLEFIGAEGITSDIEILNILVNILIKLKIKDFRIAIGNIRFVEGASEWLGLDGKRFKALKACLLNRDLVLLEELLQKKDKAKVKLFFELIKPATDAGFLRDFCLEAPDRKMASSLNYLIEIYNLLESIGFSENLIIDLGIIRDFDYYSGMIFEVYARQTTELLGSGGRYDGLVGKFGLNVPATGFALDVDILHQALRDSEIYKKTGSKKLIIAADSRDCSDVLKLAEKLRNEGNNVELFFDNGKAIEELCLSRKADAVYEADFSKNEIKVTDFSNDYKDKNVRRIRFEGD